MVGRISSPRFVGRVRELDALERLLSGASDGSGSAVLIAGEAGIGKSRLVSELEQRARELRNFVAELEQSGRAERVELEPLDRAELAEQLEAIAGRAPSASQVEQIFVRCEGNPFFVEELVASADPLGGELPSSLRETLLLRAERVSDLTRQVLRVAAVVGRSVDHRLLAGVAGLEESQLTLALREAIDHHLLVPRADGITYAFRHALLREAIYDDTLLGERLRLHRAIAESLEAHREYAVAELAYHWLGVWRVDDLPHARTLPRNGFAVQLYLRPHRSVQRFCCWYRGSQRSLLIRRNRSVSSSS
jgi:predicted ATPase